MTNRNVTIGLLCVLLSIIATAQDARISAYASLQSPEKEAITALAFTANGAILLAADAGGMVSFWDLDRKVLLASSRLDATPLFLAGLTGERTCAVVDEEGTVAVLDILKGTAETSFRCRGIPTHATLDAGRQFLAVATKDEQLEIFDLKALMPAGVIDARDKLDGLLFLGFDRLGQQLVAIGREGRVVSWSPVTLKLLRELTLAGGELHGSRTVLHAAATNRAASVFAAGLEEVALPKGGVLGGQDLLRSYSVTAYDWSSGLELKRVKTPWAVDRITLGPGNDHVCTTNDADRSITLIDLRKGEIGSSVMMNETATALAVSADNRWLAGGTRDGTLAVWRLAFKGEQASPSAATPSLSGRIRSRSGDEPALKPGNPVKLAILGFEAKGASQDIADICVSSLSNSLANVDHITLVERRQIEQIINEQKLQLSGLTEEESVEIGKISMADVVLLGSVGRLGSSLVFSARLISVKTGKIMKGREVVCEECRDQDIYDAITMLASTIAR